MVEVDALTGLVNRRGFDRILHSEILAARRDGTPLTLMLCDLDHFKRYNDSLGHVQGDTCLKEVSRVLREVCVRPRDVASRYGGEEFALILPGTPRSGAMTFARALGKVLQSRAIPHPESPEGGVLTISGGITTCVPDDSTSAETMVMRADQALYAAKAQGRNRFFSFEMQMDTIEQRNL
jgi:diguanylate cyclase (GGDEF)-like protein